MHEVIAPITTPSPPWSRASMVSSPSSWATAYWPISATRAPMRTMPSGRCGPGWGSSMPSVASTSNRRAAARVGIATGLVVVGDLIGEGAAQEQAVVGETPNLAARLQDLAPPGRVIIAAGTRRLIGDLFELAISAWSRSRALPNRCRAWQRARPSAGRQPLRGLRASRYAARRARARRSSCCCAAGSAPRRGDGPGRADLGRARHRQVAADRGLARSACKASRTPACAISARRITATARSIRLSTQLGRAAGFARDDHSAAQARQARGPARAGRSRPPTRRQR